jgi:hypothetical protein
MIRESVSFTLDDGGTLIVLDEDVQRVYDSLWESSDVPGAVSTAALIMSMFRVRPYGRLPVGLNAPQSAVLRKAVALLHP